MVIPRDLGFHFVFLCFSYCLIAVCRYHCLGAVCDYHLLGAMFIYHHFGTSFICVRVIQMSKLYPINNKKSNQWLSIYCKIEIIGILCRNNQRKQESSCDLEYSI